MIWRGALELRFPKLRSFVAVAMARKSSTSLLMHSLRTADLSPDQVVGVDVVWWRQWRLP
jgi:hypothetical protein